VKVHPASPDLTEATVRPLPPRSDRSAQRDACASQAFASDPCAKDQQTGSAWISCEAVASVCPTVSRPPGNVGHDAPMIARQDRLGRSAACLAADRGQVARERPLARRLLLGVDAAFGRSVSNGRWLLGECCAATGSALVRIIRRPSVAPGVAGTHGARRPGRVEIASRMPTRAIRPPRLQRPERPGATRWWHRADSK
jgi:hypothetical protein